MTIFETVFKTELNNKIKETCSRKMREIRNTRKNDIKKKRAWNENEYYWFSNLLNTVENLETKEAWEIYTTINW